MKNCRFLKVFVINPRILRCLRLLVLLLSVWAIMSIQFSVMPRVCVTWNKDTVSSANTMFLTLAYSYIAAYFFFLLTTWFPGYERQTKLSPIIRRNILAIGGDIRNMLLEFARGTQLNYCYDTTDTEAILMSKNWLDNIPKFATYQHIHVTYLAFVNAQGNQMKDKIATVIGVYKDELTADQLVALENLKETTLFKTTNFMCSVNTVGIEAGGYHDLVNSFCDMQKQFLELLRLFDICGE